MEKRSFVRHIFKSLYYTNLYVVNLPKYQIKIESLLLDVSCGGCRFKFIQPDINKTRVVHDFEGYIGAELVIDSYGGKPSKAPEIIGSLGEIRWVNKDVAGIMFKNRIELNVNI